MKLKTDSSHSSDNELAGPFGKGMQGIPKVEGRGHLYVCETWESRYHCPPTYFLTLVNLAEIAPLSPIPICFMELYMY